MVDIPTSHRLKGLVLSATELRQMTDWPEALVEDYLNLLDNLVLLSNLLDIEIDQKIEEVPTDFQDGSIPFAESGFLMENNSKLFWDNVNLFLRVEGDILGKNRSKQYFYSGF